MSEELRKYVADAGLHFDESTNDEKRFRKNDFEEPKMKREIPFRGIVDHFSFCLHCFDSAPPTSAPAEPSSG